MADLDWENEMNSFKNAGLAAMKKEQARSKKKAGGAEEKKTCDECNEEDKPVLGRCERCEQNLCQECDDTLHGPTAMYWWHEREWAAPVKKKKAKNVKVEKAHALVAPWMEQEKTLLAAPWAEDLDTGRDEESVAEPGAEGSGSKAKTSERAAAKKAAALAAKNAGNLEAGRAPAASVASPKDGLPAAVRKCEECDAPRSDVVSHCDKCGQFMCGPCDAQVHSKKARMKHKREFFKGYEPPASAANGGGGGGGAPKMAALPEDAAQCDECEAGRDEIVSHCEECGQYLCEKCDVSVHSKKARMKHKREFYKPVAASGVKAAGGGGGGGGGGGSKPLPEDAKQCDECEGGRETVTAHCEECGQYLCEKCDTSVHSKKARMKHVREHFSAGGGGGGGGGGGTPIPDDVKQCDQCDAPRDQVVCNCAECELNLCTKCDQSVHSKGNRNAHARTYFGGGGGGGDDADDFQSRYKPNTPLPDSIGGCEQCDAAHKDVICWCDECELHLCAKCDQKVHSKGTRISHARTYFKGCKALPPLVVASEPPPAPEEVDERPSSPARAASPSRAMSPGKGGKSAAELEAEEDAREAAREEEAKRLRAMAAVDASKPKTIAQGWVAVTRENDPTSFIMVGIEDKKLALTGFGTGVGDFVKQLDEEKVQFGVMRIVCVDSKQQNNIGKKVAGVIKYAGVTFVGKKVPALQKFKVSSKFKQMAASLGLAVTHEFSEKADISIQSISKLLIQAGLKPTLFDFGKAGKHDEILLSTIR